MESDCEPESDLELRVLIMMICLVQVMLEGEQEHKEGMGM